MNWSISINSERNGHRRGNTENQQYENNMKTNDSLNDYTRCHMGGLFDTITNECKCFQCKGGSVCFEEKPNCILDATSANPVMYEMYWASLPRLQSVLLEPDGANTYQTTLTHDWRIGHYFFQESSSHNKHNGIIKDDKHYASLELENSLRALHHFVGNANVDKHELVIGVGSTQLMHAALYALERKWQKSQMDRSNALMNVTSRYPYYDEHKFSADFLPGMEWINYFQSTSSLSNSCIVDIITMPGNPDATMMDQKSSPCTFQVYDLAYYWPQYTPIVEKIHHDLMMFTLTKLTGHAGTRVGWAWVKDPQIAQYMRDFVNLISHGVPHESQIRTVFLLKHLMPHKSEASNYKHLFEWGEEQMNIRWDRLDKLLQRTNRFIISDRLGPYHDLYSNNMRRAIPAYLWMKCGWKDDLARGDGSCQRFILDEVGIIGREGQIYGGKN